MKNVIIYLVLIITLIVSCSKNEENKIDNYTKINVGYLSDFAGASAVSVAKEKGFFEEENLDVELFKFFNGPAEIASLISKELDFAYIGHGAHYHAIIGKVQVLFPNGISKAEKIMAGKWANIKTINDLRRKTVATHLGTSGQIILDIALQKANINHNEINITNINITNLANAFINRKVDAVSIWAPYTADIISKMSNQYIILASTQDFSDDVTFTSSFITTKNYINEYPDIVKRFSKAILKAMDYRKDNIEETVLLVAELTGNNIELVNSEIDTGEWFTSKDLKNACENGTILKWYETQQKVFLNTDVIKESIAITNYLELEILKSIL
ncbi:ABC transporter substrate-binding protein [Brachyspira alvinipulli]|uniref:ABC transporter substrate-binding protein n=1 Tax=Brachyspira alvinipulli TaxID=84379 RepID=UPI000483B2F4|nr:ABC transporter substrate-binding protein [Brachyspira alvinipulli]